MIPWPLVCAGIWLATLIAWIGVVGYSVYRDRDCRKRIGLLGDGEPLPRPTIDPPATDLSRVLVDDYDNDFCTRYGIAL